MAAISPIGENPATIFDSLCAGRSGVGPLRAFDATKFRTRTAYEIDDRTSAGQRPFRATQWLRTVVEDVLADAGLSNTTDRFPVLVGTTLRELRSVELWWKQSGSDSAVELDSDRLDFGAALRDLAGVGEVHTIACACAASLYALGMAADLIELGHADTVVVAGTDAITESAFGMFDRVQNAAPTAVRSFDINRAGMVMGEGAAAVVLRRTEAGASRHALLRGVGMNCDARYATAPDPAGVGAAIAAAHQRAAVGADDIDLVMLHGSGTQLNDSVEASVLADMFGSRTTQPMMTAIKPATGHTLGGSGLLSLIMASIALQRGLVPPIVGLTNPLPEATQLTLAQETVRSDIGVAQVNAFGFGGINAVAVIEKVTTT